jgi:hypothetical protein
MPAAAPDDAPPVGPLAADVHTPLTNAMAPLTAWPIKNVPVLVPDASNIQAWMGAVEPIITFHDADDLTQHGYVPTNAASRGLARQFIIFLSQTTDPSLKCCINSDDTAGSLAALKDLHPSTAQAIEDAAEVINSLRLVDVDVAAYTAAHRAAHTQLGAISATHHHSQVSIHLRRIMKGVEGIPELAAVVLQYGNNDAPTADSVTALFADIRRFAPSHITANNVRSPDGYDDACAVCDRRGHNARDYRTRALLFKDGRLNHAAIAILRDAVDEDRRYGGRAPRGNRGGRGRSRHRHRSAANAAQAQGADDNSGIAGLTALFQQLAHPVNADAAQASRSDSEYNNSRMLFDTGASTTMTPTSRRHIALHPTRATVTMADGSTTRATSAGPAIFPTGASSLRLPALVVPGLRNTLIAASDVARHHDVLIQQRHMYIVPRGKRPVPSQIQACGTLHNGTYALDEPSPNANVAIVPARD